MGDDHATEVPEVWRSRVGSVRPNRRVRDGRVETMPLSLGTLTRDNVIKVDTGVQRLVRCQNRNARFRGGKGQSGQWDDEFLYPFHTLRKRKGAARQRQDGGSGGPCLQETSSIDHRSLRAPVKPARW